MRIYIESHGCTRRKLEVAKLQKYFKLNSYNIVNNPLNAQYILISTCAFKKDEEEYSLERIKELKKYQAKMLVCGCLPDIAPTRYKKELGIKYLSPKNIDKIDDYYENIKYKYTDIKDVNVIPPSIGFTPLPLAAKQFVREFKATPQFLKRSIRYASRMIKGTVKNDDGHFYLYTSRGCLGHCSYCAIRHSIGSIKSKPIDVIIKEFREGFDISQDTNFVILGDDVGAYGQDIGCSFPQLLSALLSESKRIRENGNGNSSGRPGLAFHLHEIHPQWLILFKKELLELLSSKEIKSILIPIQSGSDRILKLMKREHTAEDISEIIAELHTVNPNIELTTQIMIGFPTETQRDFQNTLRLLEKVRFNGVTIFPYDDKENTPAARLIPKVSEKGKRVRIAEAQMHLKRLSIETFLSCQ